MNINKAKNSILINSFYKIIIVLLIFTTIISYIPIQTVIAATNNSNVTNAVVEKAIECHRYLREHRYTYGGGYSIPDGIYNSSIVDCSAYVSWVLYEIGCESFKAYQETEFVTRCSSGAHPELEEISNKNDVQPGDILVYRAYGGHSGHVELAAQVENGQVIRVYNCGSNSSILAEGTSEYPETSFPSRNISEYSENKIYRVKNLSQQGGSFSLSGDEDEKIPALVPYLVNSIISKYARTPISNGTSKSEHSEGKITNYEESGDGWLSVTEVTYPNNSVKKYRNYQQGISSFCSYWNKPYWDGNMQDSGCGPTAVAIVLSGYGYDANPGYVVDIMNNKFGKNSSDTFENLREPLKYIANIEAEDHYTTGSSSDIETIRNSFKQGRPVIVNAPNHYIVLLGEDSNGKLIVSDPGSKFYISKGYENLGPWAGQGPDTLEEFVNNGMIECGYILITSDEGASNTSSSSSSTSSNTSNSKTTSNNPQSTGEAKIESCPAEKGGYDAIFTSGTTGRQFKLFRQNLDGWNEKYPITQFPGVWESGWRSECGTVSVMTIGSGYSADASFDDVVSKLEASGGQSSLDGWIKDYTGQNLNWSYSYSKDEIANKLSNGCVALLHSTSSLVSSSGTHYMSILDIKSDKSAVYLSNPWQGSNYQGWITFDQLSAIFESIAFVTNDGSFIDYSGSGAVVKNIAEDKIFYIGDSWMELLRASSIPKSSSSYFYAKSAKNADWVLDTYSSMKIPEDASCIVVEFGLNGTDKWNDTQNLINKLKNDYPNKDIFVLQTPHVCKEYDYYNIKADELNSKIDDYNNKMKDYCDNKENVTFINPTKNIVDNNGEGYLKNEYSNETYFHLNTEGNKIWYKDIIDLIKSFARQYEESTASGTKQFSNPTFSQYIIPNDNNGYKLNIDLDSEVDRIIRKLKEKDFDINDYLATAKKKEYLKNILKACIVVQYPDLRAAEDIAKNKETDEMQGCIRVKRYPDSDTISFSNGLSNIKDNEDDGIYLSYMPYDKLSELVNNSDKNALNYFSLDRNNNLVFAGWEKLDVNVSIRQIAGEQDPNPDPAPTPRTQPYSKLTLKNAEYLSQISNYSVPFSLFWSLLVYGGDEKFINDFAELVINTDIVIGCYDATTTKETTYTNKYDKHDITTETVWVNNKIAGETTVEKIYTYEVTEKQILKTDNPALKIKSADTWTAVYNIDYEIVKKETGSSEEIELEDEISDTDYEQVTRDDEITERLKESEGSSEQVEDEKERLKQEVHNYNYENFKYRYGILNDAINNEYSFSGKYAELLKVEDVQNFIINMIIDENSANYIKNEFNNNNVIQDYADEIDGSDIKSQAADAVIVMVENARKNNGSKGSLWDRLTKNGDDTRKNKKLEYDVSAISYMYYQTKKEQTEKVDIDTTTPEIQEKTSENGNVRFKVDPHAKENSFVKLFYYSKKAKDNLDLIMDWFIDSLENTAAIADMEDLIKYLFQCTYHTDFGIKEEDIKGLLELFDPKKMQSFSQRTTPGGTIIGGASYSSIKLTDEDMKVFYKLIQAEGGGGSHKQMMYLACAVLNRILSSAFNVSTVSEVAYAPGQFEVMWNGMYDAAIPSQETIDAVDDAIRTGDITGGAIGFANDWLYDQGGMTWEPPIELFRETWANGAGVVVIFTTPSIQAELAQYK